MGVLKTKLIKIRSDSVKQLETRSDVGGKHNKEENVRKEWLNALVHCCREE
jgi:hypothetical protein